MTEPLTPPGLDLREFDWMPLDVVRLRDSDLSVIASGEAFRAAVLLWCAAWHQVPAGSVPDDDRFLARFSGYGKDMRGWSTVRDDALRGFVKCSDGRLYHPLVCQKAVEANEQRNAKRKRTESATNARRGGKRDVDRDVDRNDGRENRRNEHHLDPDLTLPSEAHASDAGCASFDAFWEEYPRRDSDEQRDRALTEYTKLVDGGADPKVIAFGARAYCAKVRKQNNYATRYVKVAWRWLLEQDFSGVSAIPVADVPAEPAPKDWRSAVARWKDNESLWPRWAGNAPGSLSCKCPAEILAEFGICPNTGRRIDETWHFAEVDTPELAANLSVAADCKLKIRLYDFTKDGVTKTGAFFMKRIPPGYDEATGERIQSNEDAA